MFMVEPKDAGERKLSAQMENRTRMKAVAANAPAAG
jgi:hypothetical protein